MWATELSTLTDEEWAALYEALHRAWNAAAYLSPLGDELEELLNDMEDALR